MLAVANFYPLSKKSLFRYICPRSNYLCSFKMTGG